MTRLHVRIVNPTRQNWSASCFQVPAFDVFALWVPLTSEGRAGWIWGLSLKQTAIGNLFVGAVPKPNLMIQMTGGRT